MAEILRIIVDMFNRINMRLEVIISQDGQSQLPMFRSQKTIVSCTTQGIVCRYFSVALYSCFVTNEFTRS